MYLGHSNVWHVLFHKTMLFCQSFADLSIHLPSAYEDQFHLDLLSSLCTPFYSEIISLILSGTLSQMLPDALWLLFKSRVCFLFEIKGHNWLCHPFFSCELCSSWIFFWAHSIPCLPQKFSWVYEKREKIKNKGLGVLFFCTIAHFQSSFHFFFIVGWATCSMGKT